MVQERNKAKNPPKAPEKAPFFLPSLPGESVLGENVDSRFSTESTAAEISRISRFQQSKNSGGAGSAFTSYLQSGRRSGNFHSFFEHIKHLTPTKIDLEIRSLKPQTQGGHSELSDFVFALTSQLRIRQDFELVNAWMAVFLKIHADTVRTCSDQKAGAHAVLREALVNWSQEQQKEGERLAGLVGYCRGVVGFLRSSR